MSLYQLYFASGEQSLDVRHFVIQEAVSSLFHVTVMARSRPEHRPRVAGRASPRASAWRAR